MIMFPSLLAARRTRSIAAMLLTACVVLGTMCFMPHASATSDTIDSASASRESAPAEGNYNITNIGPHTFIHESWNYANYSSWPAVCGDSKRQSPVSFDNVPHRSIQHSKHLGRLKLSPGCNFNTDTINMHVMNEQNKIFVTLHEENKSLAALQPCTVTDPLNPKRVYRFQHISFHVPGEHVFPYGRADAEMHISFDTSPTHREVNGGGGDVLPGELAIFNVAVALQVVNATKETTVSARALQQMLLDGALPPPHSRTTSPLYDGMNLSVLLPARQSYLLYHGSLTSPPCTEGVRWVVMTNPMSMTEEELHRLYVALKKAAMPNTFVPERGNAREVQPLSKRTVYRFLDPLTIPPATVQPQKTMLRWVSNPQSPVSPRDQNELDAYVDNRYVDADLKASLRHDAEARARRSRSEDRPRAEDESHLSDASATSSSDESSSEHHHHHQQRETKEEYSEAAAAAAAKRAARTTLYDLFDGTQVTGDNETSEAAAASSIAKNEHACASDAEGGEACERAGKKKKKRNTHKKRRDLSEGDDEAAAPRHRPKSGKRHRSEADTAEGDATGVQKKGHGKKKRDDDDADGSERSWMARCMAWLREVGDDLWNALRAHPYGVLGFLFGLLLLAYVAVALCTPRSTTPYDVGVDPQLLQPLRRTRRAADYGTNIP